MPMPGGVPLRCRIRAAMPAMASSAAPKLAPRVPAPASRTNGQ